MKKIFFLLWIIQLFSSVAGFTESFIPDRIVLSAPGVLTYYFDGSDLWIPFKVSGKPADGLFMIYRDNWSENITNIQNGHLGWHYVNKRDTCLYIAPLKIQTGDNDIKWNGRDQEGNQLSHHYAYGYYILAFDNSNPVNVTESIHFLPNDRSIVQTTDTNGNLLVQPYLYDAPQLLGSSEKETMIIRKKWRIGDDPSNSSLVETTSYDSWIENSRLTFSSGDNSLFFTQSLRPDGTLALRKWRWVPNGNAQFMTNWGNNGESVLPTALTQENPIYSGPMGDGLSRPSGPTIFGQRAPR